MEKILISGVSGFVGSNLKPYLKKKFDILGVSRKANSAKNIISYLDLAEKEFNESKAFIHLAGKAHDLKKISSDREYFEVNTELTKDLFKKFLTSDCEIFVYLSSVKAVADSIDGILDELKVPNPLTAYGKSKLAAEEYLLSCPLPPEKRLYIFRPGMIHGPNNKGNLNLLYQFIRTGIPYPLGAFNNNRSFVSVENLCFIIKTFLEKKPVSGIYNIADNQPISTNDLVKSIGEACGKKTRIAVIPQSIIRRLARGGDKLNLPLNSERLQKLTENYVISNTKVLEAIQSDLPYDTRSGIKKTIQSFSS